MSQNLEQSMRQTPALDGQLANIYTLTNKQGSKAVFMDIGAYWLSCQIKLKDGSFREALLGRDNMADHLKQEGFLGATVGRYANRIKNAMINYKEHVFELIANQGAHQLHGGPHGFDKKRWFAKKIDPQTLCFSAVSEDGDQGYPGTLHIDVTYQLTDDNEVIIYYKAQLATDCHQETPVNLTNHAYFNLNEDKNTIKDHQLQIFADFYLPTDAEGIPLNGLVSVANTGFDFRQMKEIGQDLLKDEHQKITQGYDHSFLINPQKIEAQEPFAILRSHDNKLTMKVITNKPAVQLYTANFLAGNKGRFGTIYQAYAGVCLETQFLPDSPNRTDWPHQSCWLKPGEIYQYKTNHQFIVE